jgi:AraC-like DNA-binding protein
MDKMAMKELLVVSRGRPGELIQLFSKSRWEVNLCTPRKALDRLESGVVQAVLLDGNLKQREDFQLIKKLKVRHPGVLVIYLAEGGSENAAVEAFRHGARDYYRKPVNLYDLKRNVLRLIALKESSRGKRRPYLWAPLTREDTLSEVRPNVPTNLLRAIAYMEDHLDGEISLAALAEQAGMSKYHFCRVFKSTLGESPVRYLIRLRVERGRLLLSTTDLAVSEVSDLVGFGDSSSFARTFKRFHSMSPTRYRQRSTPD